MCLFEFVFVLTEGVLLLWDILMEGASYNSSETSEPV
jgi:hypothetical protein